MPHCSTLRLFVPNGLQVYHNFFFSEGCACDACDWPRFPSLWLSSCGDYSPTAPAAPSSRPLIPSSSLIRCKPVQVYHHHLCSFPRAMLWAPLLLFWRGPTPPQCQPTSHSPVEGPTIRFLIPNSAFFLRHSCRFAPQSFIPLLRSWIFCHFFSAVGPL
jgi:hypothetical protein